MIPRWINRDGYVCCNRGTRPYLKPPLVAARFWPLKKTWYEFRLDPLHPLTLQLGPAEYCQSDRHYRTDKGSTPRILAPILASDSFERAFLLHDSICLHHGAYFAETPTGPFAFRHMSSPEAHAMLRTACKADGASPTMQRLIWAAVRLFGPRW